MRVGFRFRALFYARVVGMVRHGTFMEKRGNWLDFGCIPQIAGDNLRVLHFFENNSASICGV